MHRDARRSCRLPDHRQARGEKKAARQRKIDMNSSRRKTTSARWGISTSIVKRVNCPFTALTFALILVVPFLLGAAPGRQGGQPVIQMAAQAGYNGFFREGQWIPVQVSATNTGAPLSGYVRVRTSPSGGLEETSYRVRLDLPEGSRKQVFLYVSLSAYTRALQVELVDSEGEVVERTEAAIQRVSRSDLLYAVVTDSPYGSVDLTGEHPGTGQAYQVNWAVDDLPPEPAALAGLDVLMFHDVDTGSISLEQREAIRQWVARGGHLVIAGGSSWQRTTAAFADVLPVTVTRTATAQSLAPLAEYVRFPGGDLAAATAIAVGRPEPAAVVLVAWNDVPLITRSTIGMGAVDFLAIEPNSEPLRSWSGKARLWSTLVASTGQRPSWAEGFTDWETARQATLTTFNTTLPTLTQLCGFLALYVVLIGPLNYVILRRLNRREWAWVTIPLLIVGFSVLAYRAGFNLRGNIATVSRLSVVQVAADHDRARVDTLIGVQSPRRATYTVEVEQGFQLRTLPGYGSGLGVPVDIAEESRYVAESIPIDAGTIVSLAANGSVTAPEIEGHATWHLGAQPVIASDPQSPSYWVRVDGSFTNTLPVTLHDAVVVVKGASAYLGSIAPGDTRSFDFKLGAQAPGALTTGDAYAAGSPSYRSLGAYGVGGGWCFSPQGVGVTISDVMRDEQFPCSVRALDHEVQEIRRRYRLLAALAVETEYSTGRGMGAYVFGWTDTRMLSVDLENRGEAEEDTTLYIFDLPVSVQASDAEVLVPPGLTTWSHAAADDPNAILDIGPEQFRLVSGAHATFQFMPMPPVRFAAVTELTLSVRAIGAFEIGLWDWDREQWVLQTFAPDTTEVVLAGEDAAPYIGPERMVRVRVVALNAAAYNQIDYIEVMYRGRLAGGLEQ